MNNYCFLSPPRFICGSLPVRRSPSVRAYVRTFDPRLLRVNTLELRLQRLAVVLTLLQYLSDVNYTYGADNVVAIVLSRPLNSVVTDI